VQVARLGYDQTILSGGKFTLKWAGEVFTKLYTLNTGVQCNWTPGVFSWPNTSNLPPGNHSEKDHLVAGETSRRMATAFIEQAAG
jgi:hypothetical protein